MEMSGPALFLLLLIVALLFFTFMGACKQRDGYFPYQYSNTKRRNRTITGPRLIQEGDRLLVEWRANPQLVYNVMVGHRHAPLRMAQNVTADDKRGHFSVEFTHVDLEPIMTTDDKVQVEIWTDAHDVFHQYVPVTRREHSY